MGEFIADVNATKDNEEGYNVECMMKGGGNVNAINYNNDDNNIDTTKDGNNYHRELCVIVNIARQ